MPEQATGNSHSPPQSTPGQRWVENYLLPLLCNREGFLERSPLRTLNIVPQGYEDAEDEAQRLRDEGHDSDVLFCAPRKSTGGVDGESPPDPLRLPVPDTSVDLILVGRMGVLVPDPEERVAFAKELVRILKPGGAVLMSIGNRLCPLDLSGNASRLHGPGTPTLLSLSEAETLFVGRGGFQSLLPLSVAGHFGGSRSTGLAGLVLAACNANWRWFATPGRRRLYASPFNPVLMLWIQK